MTSPSRLMRKLAFAGGVALTRLGIVCRSRWIKARGIDVMWAAAEPSR